MKHWIKIAFLCLPLWGFSNNDLTPSAGNELPAVSLACDHTSVIIRPQTSNEAFSYILDLAKRLDWFKENGYLVTLPLDCRLDYLYEKGNELTENEKQIAQQLFFDEIYRFSEFNLSLKQLNDSETLISKGIKKLERLSENWGFKKLNKYEVVLTFYGPGGDYNAQKGTIRLFTTPKGEFKKATGYEVLMHEIVHIGIEDTIVKKYGLSHWEKERLVDLICSLYLKELLPAYRLQSKGDERINHFVDENAIIQDLPSAIAKYVKQYPRL